MTGNLPASEETTARLPQVTLLLRRSFRGNYSIEGITERLRDGLDELGVPVRVAIAPVVSSGLANRIAIARFAARNQGEITHVMGDINFAALATSPGRTVLTIHDCEHLRTLSGARRALLHRFWFAAPARRVAAVTTVSQRTRDELLAYVPDLSPEKVFVIPNAVSPRLRPRPKPPPEGPPTILQVGTKANKNVQRLLEALAGFDCTLHLVGPLDADLRDLLRRYAVRYQHFENLSEDEMAARYEAADILAFASLAEGFGMPIVEAQTVGRPIITSRTTSMPEVAGEGAHFVDPVCVNEIAAAIRRIAGDPAYRNALVEAGSRNAARFDARTITKAYLRIYQSLV